VEWRDLGQSGLRVPIVGMGTWLTFDVYGKEEQAARRDLVTTALDQSVRLFDSSPMYGEAERILGSALTGRRERAVVATKVWSNDLRAGHAQIDRALLYFEGRVDLYQVHNLVRWRDYLPVLERMRKDGTARATGVTHYQTRAFPELAEIMASEQIDAIQIPYNALNRAAERELLPLAAQYGIGVVVMQPLGEGRLTRTAPQPAVLRQFQAFGCYTWPQVLLKWILSDPRVTAVIPATRDPDHLLDNAAAGEPPWFGPRERAEIAMLAEAAARG
jgi:aryl-alcohol dehydrogenase-like predicted oxidoreductase